MSKTYKLSPRQQAPEYIAWANMLRRCRNPNHPSWKNYGGRGIGVCERWKSYDNFLSDMGRKPSPLHTLERNNNELGYGPENCRWSTRHQQLINRRNNWMITRDGLTLCSSDWCRRVGLKYMTFWVRVKRYGWTVDRALSEPTHPHRTLSR